MHPKLKTAPSPAEPQRDALELAVVRRRLAALDAPLHHRAADVLRGGAAVRHRVAARVAAEAAAALERVGGEVAEEGGVVRRAEAREQLRFEQQGLGFRRLAAGGLEHGEVGEDGRVLRRQRQGAAMGGEMYQDGERVPTEVQDIDSLITWTRRLMKANEVNPDPNTALVVATSCMLGLNARARTGKGQQLFIDMFGANAYANHDDFLAYPGKPARPMPDEGLHGLSATYRLYRCSKGWVFLAATNAAEQQRFAAALAALGIDGPSADQLGGGEDLAVKLENLFATRSADAWQADLVPYRVPCLRADTLAPAQFWLGGEQSNAMGMTTAAEHPSWGPYRRHGPMSFFDGRHDRSLGGPPLAGQHNAEVLRDVGYDDAAIAQLAADGVIWTEVES